MKTLPGYSDKTTKSHVDSMDKNKFHIFVENLGSSSFPMDKMIFNSRPHWFL
jgi:hypothetical protein